MNVSLSMEIEDSLKKFNVGIRFGFIMMERLPKVILLKLIKYIQLY